MPHFPSDHVFILPNAQGYRQFFDVSSEQVLDCLNTPDTTEGLATNHYTAEKTIHNRRLYVYYYLTYPLQATDTDVYAIVDFIGCTEAEQQTEKHGQKENSQAKKKYDQEYFKRKGAIGGKKRIANTQTRQPKSQNP